MISTAEALKRALELVAPLGAEDVPLTGAAGRVLARDVTAPRDQPPFAASAMDGYALAGPPPRPGDTFRLIGQSVAGKAFPGTLQPGEAVRILTGAPVPTGADRVVIQEHITRTGNMIKVRQPPDDKPYIRPRGDDFRTGDTLTAPRHLTPADIALLAAMNVAEVPVTRRPEVAVLSVGDELIMPGAAPDPDRIIASNGFGLKALLEAAGADVRLLPVAADTARALRDGFGLARGADLIVTSGGASVGDRDLVAQVAAEIGMSRAFHGVAMRPGKPLMAGRLAASAMIGLPGNPVSAMVCGHIFVLPMVERMLGLPYRSRRRTAPLARALGANGPREHYMRGRIDGGELTAFARQDSALLSVLSRANALIVRPPDDPARQAGEMAAYIPV